MPAALNIAANLLFGAGLLLAVRRSPGVQQAFVSWALLLLLVFEALLFTPVATYWFRFYPQWSLFYAFDPQLYPELERWLTALSALAVLANFGAAVAGFGLARLGVLRARPWLWMTPLGIGALALLLGLTLLGDRVIAVADFDTFWQGRGTFFLRLLPGWFALALYASLIGFVAWVHRRFRGRDPQLL